MESGYLRRLPRMLEITDFSASELDIYARLTEAQLLNRDRPERGAFYCREPESHRQSA